jgi:hypothetical protein
MIPPPGRLPFSFAATTNSNSTAWANGKSFAESIVEIQSIEKDFREKTRQAVEDFRRAAKPCALCGHVMEIDDAGQTVTVCVCMYAAIASCIPNENPKNPDVFGVIGCLDIRLAQPLDTPGGSV